MAWSSLLAKEEEAKTEEEEEECEIEVQLANRCPLARLVVRELAARLSSRNANRSRSEFAGEEQRRR